MDILKFANRFNNLVSQVVVQQDVGDAEKKVLISSGIATNIQGFIKQYFAKQNIQVAGCSIKITLTVTTNDKGDALGTTVTQFNPYCSNVDISFNYSDLATKLLNTFGQTVSKLMLTAYKTNAACKNVLKSQFTANPNTSQVVVISI
jgi:hypothetical protein